MNYFINCDSESLFPETELQKYFFCCFCFLRSLASVKRTCLITNCPWLSLMLSSSFLSSKMRFPGYRFRFCLDIFNIAQTLPNKLVFCRKLIQYIVSKCLKFRLTFQFRSLYNWCSKNGIYFYQELQVVGMLSISSMT